VFRNFPDRESIKPAESDVTLRGDQAAFLPASVSPRPGPGAAAGPGRSGCDPATMTEPVLTIEPTPVLTVTATPVSSVPSTTSAQAPASTTKAPVRKTPARKPPRYGYECRDGDELKYDICAGHKAWVDGQREFAECLSGGGTWDEATQRCVRP